MRSGIDEEMKEFFESIGYGTTFLKKDARVLWNENNSEGGNWEFIDLIVEEFCDPIHKQHLHKKYRFDFGNSLIDWKDWTLQDVLVKLFVFGNIPEKLKKKVILQLSKVQEWRPFLYGHIRNRWYDY